MESEIRKFKNVWGVPYINAEAREALRAYNVLVSVESLFSDKYVENEQTISIVVDGFGRLRSCGLPILGYVKMNDFRYVRDPSFILGKTEILPNDVSIQRPVYVSSVSTPAIPALKHLLQFNRCKTDEDFKALQSKYGEELVNPKKRSLKWLRRAINMALNGPKDSKHSTGHPKQGELEQLEQTDD